jgi:signal transduction histidine kinase
MIATGTGLLAATLSAIALIALWPRSPARWMHDEVMDEVRHLDEGLRVEADGRLRLAMDYRTAATFDAMPKDAAYQVRDAHGRVVAQSQDGPARRALDAMSPGDEVIDIDNDGRPLKLHVAQAPLSHPDYIARVARSDRLVTILDDYASRLYLRAGLAAMLLALATFALVSYLTMRRMLRPLHEASQRAARISPRNLQARLRTEGLPSELAPLIEAFNAALSRLENGFRVQQEFLASAAHELKTPLALLRAEIELGGTADTQLLLRDTNLMARQIHQLLQLAEVSEGHNYQFEQVDLPAALNDAVQYMERLADRRAVHLLVCQQASAIATIEGDSAAIFVLLKNLLENAIHHSPSGGTVQVSLGTTSLCIEDEGPGVAAQNRMHVFERFWRANGKDGDGAGLGLAICKEICQAHGWRIGVETGEQGGARFVVSMTAPDSD